VPTGNDALWLEGYARPGKIEGSSQTCFRYENENKNEKDSFLFYKN